MNKKQVTGLEVQLLSRIREDERGLTFHIKNGRSGNFILAYRKAGSSSGRHYHTWIAAHKNPEILYLLSGIVKIRWWRIAEVNVEEMIA